MNGWLGCDFEGRVRRRAGMVPAAGSLIKKTLLSTARLRESELPSRAKPRHAGAGRAFPRNTAKPDAQLKDSAREQTRSKTS